MDGTIKSFLKIVIPPDDSRQVLRLRRFFMAMAMYILCLFLAYISYMVGILEWKVISGYLIIIPSINIFYYIMLRTGLNLRMRDPSFTIPQIYTGILVVMYGMYYANEARGLLLLIYILVLIFGIYRLNTRQFFFVSLFILVTYGINIVLLHIYHPYDVNFTIEYLQWVILAIVLFAFSVMAGNISSLRHNLSNSHARLKESLKMIREIAIRDDLTGLLNRRHLMELIHIEKERSARTGACFFLILIDIDYFKNINDTHGHLKGDKILKDFAELFHNSMRGMDFCGRFGGEEFLIVLPQTNLQGAMIFAERLRSVIENYSFSCLEDDTRITASLGLTEYRNEEDIDITINRADKALYKAKESGRNQVKYL